MLAPYQGVYFCLYFNHSLCSNSAPDTIFRWLHVEPVQLSDADKCVYVCACTYCINMSYCCVSFCQLPTYQIAFSMAAEFTSSPHASSRGLWTNWGFRCWSAWPRPPRPLPLYWRCCWWKVLSPTVTLLSRRRLADVEMPFPEAVLSHAKLCWCKDRLGVGRRKARKDTACQSAWATYKQTWALLLKHFLVQQGGCMHTAWGLHLRSV